MVNAGVTFFLFKKNKIIYSNFTAFIKVSHIPEISVFLELPRSDTQWRCKEIRRSRRPRGNAFIELIFTCQFERVLKMALTYKERQTQKHKWHKLNFLWFKIINSQVESEFTAQNTIFMMIMIFIFVIAD